VRHASSTFSPSGYPNAVLVGQRDRVPV